MSIWILFLRSDPTTTQIKTTSKRKDVVAIAKTPSVNGTMFPVLPLKINIPPAAEARVVKGAGRQSATQAASRTGTSITWNYTPRGIPNHHRQERRTKGISATSHNRVFFFIDNAGFSDRLIRISHG